MSPENQFNTSIDDIERVVVKVGTSLFWNGKFENWSQINKLAEPLKFSPFDYQAEQVIKNVLLWFSVECAKHFSDKDTFFSYFTSNNKQGVQVSTKTPSAPLSDRLILVFKNYGRHTTASMLLTELARTVRDMQKGSMRMSVA